MLFPAEQKCRKLLRLTLFPLGFLKWQVYYNGDKKYPSVVGIGARFALDQIIFVLQIIFLLFDGIVHGLRTPNEGINQRNLKIWANVADKIGFGRT